jgi:hypothetical protein
MLPYDASPKAISRRTSYLRVRLAFHLYPQVIRAFCNMLRFGPPRSFTCASTCPWIGHPVSGLFIATNRPIQPRFHYASDKCLKLATTNNSLDRSTKSTQSQPKLLLLLVRTQFQDLFHSPSGVLLTFPSRYLYTIDRKIYLALEGGPSRFNQGFTCPDLLDTVDNKVLTLRIPGYHRLWRGFPTTSACIKICNFTEIGTSISSLMRVTDLGIRMINHSGRVSVNRYTIGRPQKAIYRSQPLYNIRLVTYLPADCGSPDITLLRSSVTRQKS